MHTRENALNEWLKTEISSPYMLTPLAGDASFRRYYRLQFAQQSRIVMDAPPEKESLTAFIKIAQSLAHQGIHTPKIYAIQQTQGFLLLEDLGDDLMLGLLTSKTVDLLYKNALATLQKLHQISYAELQLPQFDQMHIQAELSLFSEWFLNAYLDIQLNTDELLMLQNTFTWISEQLSAQPQVFVHRDYHSRNLMVLNDQSIGVIDFQDAVVGPFTYDLVSLLKDCYIQWPPEKVMNWLRQFFDEIPNTYYYSFSDFVRAFDICGLQRHLKVLGIFCRLHLRDHKSGYLRDLPLTFNYTMNCLENYPELQSLHELMLNKIKQPFFEKIAK